MCWLLSTLFLVLMASSTEAVQLEPRWEIDLLSEGQNFGVLHVPSLGFAEALVQVVLQTKDPLVLEIQGTYYNLVPSTDPPDGNRPALGIVPVASSGRGPSSAKKELEVLERFEHGSALALTVTREGFDPLSQQVPAAVLLGPKGNKALAVAVDRHEEENDQSSAQGSPPSLGNTVPKLPVKVPGKRTSSRGTLAFKHGYKESKSSTQASKRGTRSSSVRSRAKEEGKVVGSNSGIVKDPLQEQGLEESDAKQPQQQQQQQHQQGLLERQQQRKDTKEKEQKGYDKRDDDKEQQQQQQQQQDQQEVLKRQQQLRYAKEREQKDEVKQREKQQQEQKERQQQQQKEAEHKEQTDGDQQQQRQQEQGGQQEGKVTTQDDAARKRQLNEEQQYKPVINILHFNDWHNRMEPTYKPWNSPCDQPGADTSHCSGGIARLKKWLDDMRSSLGKGNTLVLNSGDDFIGTVWDQKYKTEQASHFMNLLGPDVMTVGNHEFDHGTDELANYLDTLHHPALGACNIEVPEWHRLSGKLRDYVSHYIEGAKVCIFGLATDFFNYPEKAYPVKVKDAYWSGKECVERMRADGCQVVVLLSHIGYTADIAAAEKIPGIDLIVGGHSHSLLWGDGKHEGPSLDHDNPSTPADYVWGSYPTWVSSKVEDKKVPVVQAGWGSRYTGVVQIWMKPDHPGQIKSITGWPVLLGGPRSDNPVAEDDFMKEEVKKWRYW